MPHDYCIYHLVYAAQGMTIDDLREINTERRPHAPSKRCMEVKFIVNIDTMTMPLDMRSDTRRLFSSRMSRGAHSPGATYFGAAPIRLPLNLFIDARRRRYRFTWGSEPLCALSYWSP